MKDKNTGTFKELFENTSALAKDKELRKKTEEEISKNLPEGHSFHINDCGFGHFMAPLYISNKVNEGVKDDI